MERRRNRTPGRFLRRNKPYFLLALTLVLLTAAVIFGVKIMRELRTPAQPSVPASVQEPVTPAQPETDVHNTCSVKPGTRYEFKDSSN